MKEENHKALRKNNQTNMKMGEEEDEGDEFLQKNKINIRWNDGEDETDIIQTQQKQWGSVRPGTLYYKYARNYFKFNLRRECEGRKKQCSNSFELHIADFYAELKKKNCPFFFFFFGGCF